MAQKQTLLGNIADAEQAIAQTIGTLRLAEADRFDTLARVAGQAELAASSLDAQFESLENEAMNADVEARLAALKAAGA